MPSKAYTSYAMGPHQVSFLFQSWVFHQFIMLYVGVCYSVKVLRHFMTKVP